jgi:hypothetical protein
MTITNDDSRVINKLDALLTDDDRAIIYNRHMFIVQATELEFKKTKIKILVRRLKSVKETKLIDKMNKIR